VSALVARRQLDDESGVALVIALMAMSLMLALSLALILTTMTETRVAANHRRGIEALYAAQIAADRVVQELRAAPDWNAFLSGAARSTLVDGAPPGVDLVDAPSAHQWGAHNPVWQVVAFGPVASFLPATATVPAGYVVVWVGDDPSDNDGDPRRDGAPPAGCESTAAPPCEVSNPGLGIIEVLAQASGPDGTRRTVQVTLSRRGELVGGRVESWRQDD